MSQKLFNPLFVMLILLGSFTPAYARTDIYDDGCLTSTDECYYNEQDNNETPSGSGSDQLLEYIRVTSPNGGEILGRNADSYLMTTIQPMAEYQITWQSLSTQVDKVDLLYSLDFGNTYTAIAEKIDNNGYFNWSLPNVDSDQALIRINAFGTTGTNLGSDKSNSPFVIRNFQPTAAETSTNVSEYKALFISQSTINTVNAGETFDVNVTFKNVGSATWYRFGDYPVHLGASSPHDRISVFQNSSWLTENRPAMMYEDVVAPGEIATFIFTMTAPTSTGHYHEVFSPVAEGLTWMDTSPVTLDINVI